MLTLAYSILADFILLQLVHVSEYRVDIIESHDLITPNIINMLNHILKDFLKYFEMVFRLRHSLDNFHSLLEFEHGGPKPSELSKNVILIVRFFSLGISMDKRCLKYRDSIFL